MRRYHGLANTPNGSFTTDGIVYAISNNGISGRLALARG